jgi:pimeloyl-ACP methyl ester carboxylesterase
MQNTPASYVGLTTEVQEKFLEIGGARMRYLQAGSGPPLVLIHGLLGYSFSWRFTLPAVSAHATAYAVDMLGAGFSDRPRDLDCSLRASAKRVLEFIRSLGLTTFDLVGTSHGGGVAMMVAALCTEATQPRLRRLVLVAPINPWSEHGKMFAPFMATPAVAATFKFVVTTMPWTRNLALDRLYGDPRQISEDTYRGYRAPYRKAADFDAGFKIARRWNEDMCDLASNIPKISNYPALLLWGDRDRAVYASSCEQLRQAFRNCSVRIFRGVGHLPYEEVPEEFNRELISFLTS